MAMIQFDAATARLLENAYRGRDVVKRRLATLEALAPEAGDTIVGAGAGGWRSGRSDCRRSERRMRMAAASQCNGFANVRILDGTAK
jgi:hypothetical protein